MRHGLGWGIGRVLSVLLLLLACGREASAAPAPYFTLSTYKSFAPGEKPKLHLYSRNVDELEFRVYHIEDPDKFVANLPQMHSFGDRPVPSSVEQIDEKTWLERFHDWKRGLWSEVRSFLRTQLSHEARQALVQKQSNLARRSRVVGVAQFAQIPLLNDKQLVARWKQEMPPTFVSDNQTLPIDPLPAGMYLVEATDAHQKAYTILMISQTALITRMVAGNVLAYAVDRKSGAPVTGASVSLGLTGLPLMHGTTSDEGVAEFKAPAEPVKKPGDGEQADASGAESKMWVIAHRGSDVALVAPYFGSFMSVAGTTFTSYLYTDRPVYRPGHTVHWKGVFRQYAGDSPELPKFSQAHVRVTDEQGKVALDKVVGLSPNGTVNGEVVLAKDASLGNYSVSINSVEGQNLGFSGYAGFIVEEYRKPEYEVKVSAQKEHLLQGSSNEVTIDSRYFFGEPVVGAKVKYTIQQSAHSWYGDEDDDDHTVTPGDEGDGADAPDAGDGEQATPGDEEAAGTGTLNADGKLVVKLPTRFVENMHYDKDYVVSAGVTDDAGREISGKYRFLATYGSFRIHLEPVNYFAKKGGMAAFKLTAVDYENKPVSTAIHLSLSQSRYTNGKMVLTDAGSADATTDAKGQATVQANVNLAGSIQVLATANTQEKRTVQDSSWIYASGPKENTDDEFGGTHLMKIIADKKSYAPGDTAHLSLVGDVTGFHALVIATGYTVEFRKTLGTDGQAMSFDLPITKDSQPNLTVEAVLIKDDQMYQARKSLKVPPTEQALQIEITPAAATFQPQQTAAYDVVTKDATGKPVSAELSFGVVDEAIYALYKDTSGDLLKSLYPARSVYANVDSSLDYYFEGEAGSKSPMLAERHARYRPMLAQVKSANDVKQPHVRKDFPDTAFWAPDIHTDASGHARVTMTFPDSLTTWRATVRAVTADSKAGSLINRVIVRKNIIVRMGQPRFLRKGDTVSIPVIVHNYLATAKPVQLSLDATGLDLVGGATQSVNVNPKGEATAFWKFRASSIGTAKLLAKAITNEESDALEVTFPVKPSGVRKTLTASGSIQGSGEHSLSIDFPTGTDAGAHTLAIEVSPSIAGSLFGALDYLSTFPYGCTEQTMSSFLPNILIADATKKLSLQKPVDPALLATRIKAGFDRLADYQHEDGGWGWWKEDTSQVFMTAYVVSGYGQARRVGYDKAGESLRKGVGFLETTLRAHPRMLPELRAYTVYALSEAGRDVTDAKLLKDETDALYRRRGDLSAQGLSFTGLAMMRENDTRSGEIATLLTAKAVKQGDRVSWPSTREPLLDIDADSSAQSTAYALKFLVHQTPDSPLLQGAALWLIANRNEGSYWSSTEQTSAALFGLTDYLVATHELDAESDVEVFVNGASAGKRHFTAADSLSASILSITPDAAHLQPQGNSIRIVSRGAGRAYFAVSGTFFSTDKSAYQQGTMALNIARDYFKLVPFEKNGSIFYKLDPLRGPVQQGDVLAVHLGVTGSREKYLLIEDPIPAGAEFLTNEGTFNIMDRPGTWRYWYTRREFHDDHAAIFATEFEGRDESFYLLKVINPGSYAISPASVQPMYQPGIQATSDELHLDVQDVTPQNPPAGGGR
ncbi:alpha-2-macroglobulin family protein [Granulicella sibirica]|uniref:Alpha-2-macroglobulin n=1 Tax=Granulicella sibirica TaxID=2479048 RepID=A0A4Q0TA25_9BACT|nr:alpha-2-macroglobulin family protein [Granulicella sibirica]RXH58616.1 hypothetical protein GRAN_1926 [Granulicella sibirica]